MWLVLRKTESRGRCAVPLILPRTRARRRSRGELYRQIRRAKLLLPPRRPSGFSGFHPDVLALVADALALVGIGFTDPPDTRCHIPNQDLIDSLDVDPVCPLDHEGDIRRRINLDRPCIADLQDKLLAALLGTIAGTDDLKGFLESLAD